jgi:sugar lactone lactonase YvrE
MAVNLTESGRRMGDIAAEQLTEPLAEHGEGPLWWPRRQLLLWVDMLAGDVLATALGGSARDHGTRRWHVGSVAAALRPRRSGGLVLALERGFALADDFGGPVHELPPLWMDPGIRMNDGGCDPDGRFYCGTMAYDEQPGAGSLYRLEPDGTVGKQLCGVTISNGFAFDPHGTTAYYVDTATKGIDAFDYDREAGLTNRRRVVDVEPPGMPDGLTVDAEGHLWVAAWDGAAVRRYRPDGRLDAVVELPVDKVTACTFGGPELDRLYVTTSREGTDTVAQPEAGALFAVDPGVRGQVPLTFAG